MLTDSDLKMLIECPKKIIEASPAKEMAQDKRNGFVLRKKMILTSCDGGHEFDVFFRQNTKFYEQFSIGLRYHTHDKQLGKVIILRYNGQHTTKAKDSSKDDHPSSFHIHRTNESLLAKKITEPSEIEITEKYSTFDSARFHFFKATGIQNANKYFPQDEKQWDIFNHDT